VRYPDPTSSPKGILARLSPLRLLAACIVLVPAGAWLVRGAGEANYTATGTFWIDSGDADYRGRSSVPRVVEASAWAELLRSSTVLESVARSERLFLRMPEGAEAAFRGFQIQDRFLAGTYVLEVGRDGTEFTMRTAEGAWVQRAPVDGPIGEQVGFRWTPTAAALPSGRELRFSVVTTADAAQVLRDQLQVRLDPSGHLLRLSLTGTNPERLVSTVDAVMDRHVAVAAELQRAKLEETLVILEEQLEIMEAELMHAETDLDAYRARTASARGREGTSLSREEARLERRLATTESLYGTVRGRVEEARLALVSSVPDVRILEPASVEETAPGDSRQRMPLLFLVLALAIAGAAAVLRFVPGAWELAPARGTGSSSWRDALPLLAIASGALLAMLATAFMR